MTVGFSVALLKIRERILADLLEQYGAIGGCFHPPSSLSALRRKLFRTTLFIRFLVFGSPAILDLRKPRKDCARMKTMLLSFTPVLDY